MASRRQARGHKATDATQPGTESLRLDKWLWYARLVPTRSRGAALVEAGHVRVNGGRVVNAARNIRTGDVLTIALERQTRLLRVAGLPERRRPFEEARLSYESIETHTQHPTCASDDL